MLRLAFLHGFLGDKEDWADVISRLQDYSCTALDYPFVVPEDAIAIGYSMGGRIALSLPQPKIVISAHVGLTSGHEERKIWEDHWLHRLQALPYEEFVRLWYAQPLFASFDAPLKRRLAQAPEKALEQFENHRLSKQPLLLPQNAYYIYGEQDKKYDDLYNQFSLNAIAIPRSGHVCHIENPEECARAIRSHLGTIQNLHRY